MLTLRVGVPISTVSKMSDSAFLYCTAKRRELVSYTNADFPEIAADHGCCRCQARSKTPAVAGYHPLVIALAAVAAGMVVDRYRPLPVAAWWTIAVAGLGGWFMLWRKRRNRAASVVLLLAGLALAASWHHCRWNLFGGDDLGLFARTQQQPVCIEAVALQTPRVIPQPEFNPLRSPRSGDEVRFEVELRAIRDGDQWRTASGRAAMVVEGLVPDLAAGDRFRAFAHLLPPEHALNPGEADRADLRSRPPHHQPPAGELSGSDFRGLDGFRLRPRAAPGIAAAPRPAGFCKISPSATGEPGRGRPAGPPRAARSGRNRGLSTHGHDPPAGDRRAASGHSRRFRRPGPAPAAAVALGPARRGRFYDRLYAAGRRRAAGGAGNRAHRGGLRGGLLRPPPRRLQCPGPGRPDRAGPQSGRSVQCRAAAFLLVRRRTDGDGAVVDGDDARPGAARRDAAAGSNRVS